MRQSFTLVAAAAVAAILPQPALAGHDRSWDRASSIGRDALVVAALGVPAIQGDWDGALQAGGSVGAAFLLTTGLKEVFPERRPDGSDNKSFPSGHAGSAFAAAATLQNRYGWQVGVPAQLAAAFVGYARVEAHKHYWYDVVVGAAIGEASGFLITSRRNESVRVLPWGDAHNAGITLSARF